MHAATTLAILSRNLLSKNFAGWEVMEVFAGGVSGSDTVFKVRTQDTVDIRVHDAQYVQDLTTAIDDTLSDTTASGSCDKL